MKLEKPKAAAKPATKIAPKAPPSKPAAKAAPVKPNGDFKKIPPVATPKSVGLVKPVRDSANEMRQSHAAHARELVSPVGKPNADSAALLATIASMKTEIATLNKQLAAKKAEKKRFGYTVEELEQTADLVSPKDWRHQYAGGQINVKQFAWNTKTDTIDRVFEANEKALIPSIIAIPSDDMPRGPEFRATGNVALLSAPTVDGQYTKINYVNKEELAALWAD